MAVTGTEGILLLVARVLFGGVVAFTGLNHFMDTEAMTGYAEHKGVPAPKLSVLGSGLVLVLGGLAIALGIYPVVGALAVAAFLVGAGLLFHDFWAVPEDQKEDEMTHFMKNVALAGGSLALAVLAVQNWAFSLGVSAV